MNRINDMKRNEDVEKNNNLTSSIFKSGTIVSVVMLSAKLFSFIRDMLLARTLGATSMSDSILLSTNLLLLLSTFIRSPFSAAYLPIATDVYFLEKTERKNKFFGNIYGIALVVGVCMMAFEAILMKPIISFLAPGFSDGDLRFLYSLMMMQLPVVTISMITAVNDGNLKMLNKFGASEISQSVIAIFYIVYLLIFGKRVTSVGLSICVVSAYVFDFCIRYAIVLKNGMRPQWSFRLREEPRVKEIGLAMLPFLIATCANEINSLIDKAVASLLDPGSITMQSYASKLTVTEVGLIATAISMVIYSHVAKNSTLNDSESLRKTVISGIKFVNTLLFPCCIFTIIFRYEIISLLFGYGAFDTDNVRITANTMMIYAIGIIGAGMEDVLTRTMHGTKHRRYPSIINIVSVCINSILNILLYKKYGIYGLAAATSFVRLLKEPFYFTYLFKKIITYKSEDHIFKDMFTSLFIALIGGAVAILMKHLLPVVLTNDYIVFGASLFAGMVVCFYGFVICRNEFVVTVFQKMNTVFKKSV